MDFVQSAVAFLLGPLSDTDWADWRGFWLTRVLEGRYVVLYFLPLIPVLLLFKRDRLRIAIVVTGLVFLAYAFGALYAGFWLLNAVVFYWLGEWFARECRRTDVNPWGPVLGAGCVIGGWHVATLLLHEIELPPAFNAWVFEHARWVFPLGVREWWFEPTFSNRHQAPATDTAPQLFFALFRDVHLIGTAYLTVRLYQYFSEIKRGNLLAERRTLLNFLAFVCYAPTLTQGPIERFAPFQEEMDTCHLRRSWAVVPSAVGRILLGLAKNLIVAWYIYPPLRDVFGIDRGKTYFDSPEEIGNFWLLYVGAGLLMTRLYLGFSGYCDVAIGMSRLFGYRVFENFKYPWLATSMRDMWRRWHLSLSFILRDYVYIGLGGNRRHVVLNIVVTFFVCGIWHAIIINMMLWGLVMGVMVAVNHKWARWVKVVDERGTGTFARVRRLGARLHPLPMVLAWLVTQHAFVWSALIIFGGGGGTYRVTREMVRQVWGWLFA